MNSISCLTRRAVKWKINILLLSCSTFLSACGAFNSPMDLQARSAATAASLERDFGVKPAIAWHYHNGIFTDIDVTFELGGVSNKSVSELEQKVRVAVGSNFKDSPQQLIVSVREKL